MPNLLFIKNLEELDYIERNLKYLLTTHKIITICSLPWLQLYSQGFSVEEVCDYLSEDEFKQVLKEARFISQEWYKNFEHYLNYRGINLGEMVGIEQIWFFRELIASYLAFQRIIEVNRPDEIILFADLDIPSLDFSRYSIANDIFPAVAIWMGEDKEISVHKLYLRKGFGITQNRYWLRLKRSITAYFPLGLFFYRYLNRFLKNIIHRGNLRSLPLHYPNTSGKRMAVAIGSAFEFLILQPVLKTLSELEDFNISFVNLDVIFDTDSKKNRSGLDADIDLKFLTFEDFVPAIPENIAVVSSLQKARKCFTSSLTCKSEFLSPPFSQLLNNPYLKFQLDFLWGDYFFNAVSIIDKFCEVYSKKKPDVIIISNAMGYRQRIFVKLAERYGAKSITVPHGWVGDIDEYDFESDLFLAWGELSQKQLIEEFNKSADHIAVVGALQFEKFSSLLRQSSSGAVRDIKEKFGLRLDSRAVLIMTNGLAQTVFSPLDMGGFLESWELIKFFIGEHPEIDFVIKPHPADEAIEWYRRLVKDFARPNLKIIEGARLESFLPAVDIGILMGEPSTAGYLCILLGVPIIILKSFIRREIFTTYEAWSADDGVLVAEQVKDLNGLLKQLLSDNDFKKATLEKEEKFLDRSLLVRDGKVRERIVKSVKNLLGK